MNRFLMAFVTAIAFILGGLLAPKEASATGPASPYGYANFEIQQF